MDNAQFIKELEAAKPFMDESVYAALVKSANAIPEGDKQALIEKVKESASRMDQVSDYLNKRTEIQKKGAEQLEMMLKESNQAMKKVEKADHEKEANEAEHLLD